MLPDNVMGMLWMLVFFVIFYIYIDVRITRLRKELVAHYMVCENMLKGKSAATSFPTVQEQSSRISVLNAPTSPIEEERYEELERKSSPSFQNLNFIMNPGPDQIVSKGVRSVASTCTGEDLIPTKEEMMFGLQNLTKNMKTTAVQEEGWIDSSSKSGGLVGYNASSDEYAPFVL